MALLADIQYGFPGEVTPAAWAQIIASASGGVYGVGGAQGGTSQVGDLRLTLNAVGDRGASIAPGTAYGHGCLGIWSTATQFNFAAAAGTTDRWDCVVIRRTWSNTPGASVTTLAVITGSASKSLPALVRNPGTMTEQPLWLVRVRGGQTAIQETIDLRCWAANGGVQALNGLAMNYLDYPGSRVTVGDHMYEYKVDSTSSTVGWEKTSSQTRVPLYGIGGTLLGTIAAGENMFLYQTGTAVLKTDAAGFGRLAWPRAFPNGVLSIVLNDGDGFASGYSVPHIAGNNNFWGTAGNGNKVEVVYALVAPNGTLVANRQHRINYDIIGF